MLVSALRGPKRGSMRRKEVQVEGCPRDPYGARAKVKTSESMRRVHRNRLVAWDKISQFQHGTMTVHIGNPAINVFGSYELVWAEPLAEKWQKLGKGPESPEVDKYLLHFAKSRVQRLAKQLKSCKELRKNKMDEKREVNVENTKKHQVYMIEQLSHTVMVASRFKDWKLGVHPSLAWLSPSLFTFKLLSFPQLEKVEKSKSFGTFSRWTLVT